MKNKPGYVLVSDYSLFVYGCVIPHPQHFLHNDRLITHLLSGDSM
ncbi:hypothetical protein AHF37_10111 [Paragonimus kellicotti]|nr:hypothetical protein AHF37_10111 [Paragonimus kellicotti]